MVTNDATILRLKHEVLYAVAKASWEGKLEEKTHDIPYEIIPGPQATYRCCIYRECAWRRGNVPRAKTPPTWCRSSTRPARSVPSPPTW